MRRQALDNFTPIAEYISQKAEPESLQTIRKDAFEAYQKTLLTPITKVSYDRWALFDPIIPESKTVPETLTAINMDNSITLYGQKMVSCRIADSWKKQGVILEDIETAIKKHAELFFKYFKNVIDHYDLDKVTGYHLAALTNGIFFYVPKGAQLEGALTVNLVKNDQEESAFNPHLLYVLEDETTCEIIEKTSSYGAEANSLNMHVELFMGNSATLSYYPVDTLNSNQAGFVNRWAQLYNDAKLNVTNGLFNHGQVITNYLVDLRGEGAMADVHAVSITEDRHQQVANVTVNNYGRHTNGNILQKGVVLDHSRLSFNGIGHIFRGANGSESEQEERLLMFSDAARGDANPILLIDENDVKAGHAASVGRVAEEELYYLMSRGLSTNEARRLVIKAFLGQVLAQIHDKDLRQEFLDLIDEKLRDHDEL